MSTKKNKSFRRVMGKRYSGIVERCYHENSTSYKNYGGKNIRMSGMWLDDSDNFYDWFEKELAASGISEVEFMKNTRKYQVDRIDPKGHYTPENCRIVTAIQNSRNKGKFKIVITAEGETRQIGGSLPKKNE